MVHSLRRFTGAGTLTLLLSAAAANAADLTVTTVDDSGPERSGKR